MPQENLEERLRKLVQQVNQVSDETTRQDLQRQIDEIRKTSKQEPFYLFEEPKDFSKEYRREGYASVMASFEVKNKLARIVISSLAGVYNGFEDYCFPTTRSSISETPDYDDLNSWVYADGSTAHHLDMLMEEIAKEALIIAKQRGADAVIIKKGKTKVKSEILGPNFNGAIWLGFKHRIRYSGESTVELYKRK